MEAKELMYGDWYSALNGDNKRDCYQFDFNDECWSDAEPEPIQLTPEILELNGWEKETTMGSFYKEYKKSWLILTGFKIMWLEIRSAKYGGLCDGEIRTPNPFKYVHQLQQALRLCGLNEIADSIKI